MIRSALALVLTASFAAPAFAQTADEKVWGAIVSVKEKITQYDEGTGKALAYWGGKTVKYSLIAVGAAYVTTQAPLAIAEGAVRNGFFSRNFFSYETPGRIGTLLRTEQLSKRVLAWGGAPVAVGIGLLGASAVVFFAEHLYYNTIGHPDQSAANSDFAQYLNLPVERQFEIAQANPAIGEKMVELDSTIHVTDIAK